VVVVVYGLTALGSLLLSINMEKVCDQINCILISTTLQVT